MSADKEEGLYRQQIVNQYRPDVERLARYLPWLEQKDGQRVSNIYKGEGIDEHSVAFPVFDATLLNFVKEASRTGLMDKNYRYVYTRNNIRTPEGERRAIERATIRDFGILKGILSKYVQGGKTKGTLWNTAVEEHIFLLVVRKMKEIIEFWDKPME